MSRADATTARHLAALRALSEDQSPQEEPEVPRAAKLKVYCTPIGFHDAYVAAPSQKAALEAWGSDANLFARGVAELVTDPALTREPLARPGEVIKRLRGTAAEQLAALPPDPPVRKQSKPAPTSGRLPERSASRPRPASSAEAKPTSKAAPKSATRPEPRPSRAGLDEIDAAVVAAERRHGEESAALAREETALARRRKALAKHQADELRRLGARRARAEQVYRSALERWRG